MELINNHEPNNSETFSRINLKTQKNKKLTPARTKKPKNSKTHKLKNLKTQMKIILDSVRIYAFHGVMPQENKIGAYFTVSAELETDFSQAMATDELEGTVSYANVFDVIKKEMATPSKLLEHVGGRIITTLFRSFPTVTKIKLRIIKENPPMGADCKGAGIEIEETRK